MTPGRSLRGGTSVGAVPDVLVAGAGVIGLTTALCLAEEGLRVQVVADRMPQATTSAVAGAIWGAHSTEPGERTARWALSTLSELRALADVPGTGVRIGSGVIASRDAATGAPPADLAGHDEVSACDPGSLPGGFASGWRYAAPLVHMPAYLGYLRARCDRSGVQFTESAVTSFAEAAERWSVNILVNCTGVYAGQLAGDAEVTPLRGQVVVAENPGIEEFFIGLPDDSHDLIYLFPHGDTVVLGGTETAGDWNLEAEPATAARILRDCASVEPRLRDGRVLAHRVGLRPFRPRVRPEAQAVRVAADPGQPHPPARTDAPPVDDLLVVHNYGHGGAGVTLSWGCAREAATLAAAHV